MGLKSILTAFVLVYAISLCGSISYAQTDTLETLKKTLLLTQNVKSRQDVLLQICAQNHSFPPDTFHKYIQMGLAISSANSQEYLKFLRFEASYLNKSGRNDAAIHLTDSILNLSVAMQNIQLFQRLRIEKCKALIRIGKSKESIANLFKNHLIIISRKQDLKERPDSGIIRR